MKARFYTQHWFYGVLTAAAAAALAAYGFTR